MVSGILVFANGAAGEPSPRDDNRAPRAGNTQFIFLDMNPLGSYEVEKNQGAFLSTVASAAGTVSFRDLTSLGDEFVLTFAGVDPFPPSRPANLTATGQSDGCARLVWTTPPASEYVSDYRIYWGVAPGAYTDSTTIDLLRVVRNGVNSSFTACGFAAGTYYFAIRARNQFDLWSPTSNEDSAVISGDDPQGPPAPQGVSVAENTPGCATISWNAVGDPTVSGYRVFLGTTSVAGGQAAAYEDSVDAGSNTSTEVCGLAAGTYYFAVKSLTAGGVSSVYSAEVSRDMVGPDRDGPVLFTTWPLDGATDVPIGTSVYFGLSDEGAGVDISSLTVRIDGAAPAAVHTVGSPSRYIVQTVLAAPLPADSTIVVEVTVGDLATPSNVSVLSWSFSTGDVEIVDTTAPAITFVRPLPDETGVRVDAPIMISIGDAGAGVDISSIELFVDGSSASFTLTGTPDDITLIHVAQGGYDLGATVSVRVEACDLAGTPNCADPMTMSFTVEGLAFAALGEGAIVPDGFWADDPLRPLEVRNLPMQWTIRIFDAAGAQVRRYRNNVSDGFNWAWDFTNNHGRRVARALYLVRVIDADGNVRQRGRFLVQAD